MTRQTPGIALDHRFIVKARNQNAENHGKKRVVLTYIYLLLIQSLDLPPGFLTIAPMSLQAKKGSGANQAAHQVLGELQFQGRPVCRLPGLPFDVQRALVYCTSAVSDIHSTYNLADNYLEEAIRRSYIALANRMRGMNRQDIWIHLIDYFQAACMNAIHIAGRHRDEVQRRHIEEVLRQYAGDALALRGRGVSVYDVAYWVQKLNAGGF